MRKNLNLRKREDKIVLWRKITRALKELYDGATTMNVIGQGSFAAAIASSLNIGCAVDRITRGICSANIGEVELNSLIFQDDIAKMNRSMEDARKGAKDIGRLLESS